MKGRRIIFDTYVRTATNDAPYWLRTAADVLRTRPGSDTLASVLLRIAATMDESEAYVPPEPTGLGAVVEAACVHSNERRIWLRDHAGNWHPETSATVDGFEDTAGADDYASLVDVEVKTKGWVQ